MTYILKELAALLGAETLGDDTLVVERLAEPAQAGPQDLALAVAPKFAEQLKSSSARAAVVWAGADLADLGLDGAIVVPRGRLAMAGLTRAMDQNPVFSKNTEIHPTAYLDPAAQIGAGAQIGAYAVIDAGVTIGDGARIASHVSIGPDVVIGDQAQLYAGVRIGPNVRIGDRFIAQPGVVIGGDGFSFTTEGPSNVERAVRGRPGVPLDPPEDSGRWHRIHSLGGVEIGHDVEIGANSTVDAGTVRATQINDGVKIDNLVQVGHNVVLGPDCLLCAQAAVAGSAQLGPRVILGGKSGVADNIILGRDVVVGGGGIVLSSVPDGVFVSGHPAQPTHTHRAGLKALRQLVQSRKS